MRTMKIEELQEILQLLDAAGMDPKVCSKPIPYYDATVQAGNPTDPGDRIVVNEAPFDEKLSVFSSYMLPLAKYIDNIHNVINPDGSVA